MTRRYTPEAEAWLCENYGTGDVNDTLDSFEERFGWRPTQLAVYQKAHKLGLVKRRRSEDRGRRVERTVRWSREPEMDAWMREHDRGHSVAKVAEDFEEAFGFRLTRTQVSQWRARNGVGRRGHVRHRRTDAPVGTERDSGKGYTVVKVADSPRVPLSKDNWRMKHHLVWEDAHGEPVPEGCEVVFADRDHSNLDPSNLVAVEKSLVGIINGSALDYWDAESLETAVAMARLMSAARRVGSGGTRTCAVCGRRFEPTESQARYAKPVATCPGCLASGRKAPGKRSAGMKECAVCGREFEARHSRQRRCRDCIRRRPKWDVEKQRKAEGRD